MQLSLQHLQYFIAVVDNGSFSKAAKQSGNAQSAISQAIMKLEQQMGFALFDRSGYRPQLTQAGVSLLPYARRCLENLSQLEAKASHLSNAASPKLTLCVDKLLDTQPLVSTLMQYTREEPCVNLHWKARVMDDANQILHQHEPAIAVMPLYAPPELDLERFQLCTMRLRAYCSRTHTLVTESTSSKVSKDALRRTRQLALCDSSGLSGKRDHGVIADHVWRIEDPHTLVECLAQGAGWGIMAEHIVARSPWSSELTPITPEHWEGPNGALTLPVFALWRKEVHPGPMAVKLIQALRDTYLRDTDEATDVATSDYPDSSA